MSRCPDTSTWGRASRRVTAQDVDRSIEGTPAPDPYAKVLPVKSQPDPCDRDGVDGHRFHLDSRPPDRPQECPVGVRKPPTIQPCAAGNRGPVVSREAGDDQIRPVPARDEHPSQVECIALRPAAVQVGQHEADMEPVASHRSRLRRAAAALRRRPCRGTQPGQKHERLDLEQIPGTHAVQGDDEDPGHGRIPGKRLRRGPLRTQQQDNGRQKQRQRDDAGLSR